MHEAWLSSGACGFALTGMHSVTVSHRLGLPEARQLRLCAELRVGVAPTAALGVTSHCPLPSAVSAPAPGLAYSSEQLSSRGHTLHMEVSEVLEGFRHSWVQHPAEPQRCPFGFVPDSCLWPAATTGSFLALLVTLLEKEAFLT